MKMNLGQHSVMLCIVALLATIITTYSQTGGAPASTKQIDEDKLAADAQVAIREINDLPVIKLHRHYVEEKPKIIPHLKLLQYRWEQNVRSYDSNSALKARSVNPIFLIPLIEVKALTEEERVSLRPELERLGVKAIQQEGDTSAIYSAQHLLQYAFAGAGMKAPSPNELTKLCGVDGVKATPQTLIKAAAEASKAAGKVPHTLEFNGVSENISNKLFLEMVKHQIRNKRLVVVSTPSRDHTIVVLGFHTKDRKMTWECLDSNKASKNGGYTTIDDIDNTGAFSLWFE